MLSVLVLGGRAALSNFETKSKMLIPANSGLLGRLGYRVSTQLSKKMFLLAGS